MSKAKILLVGFLAAVFGTLLWLDIKGWKAENASRHQLIEHFLEPQSPPAKLEGWDKAEREAEAKNGQRLCRVERDYRPDDMCLWICPPGYRDAGSDCKKVRTSRRSKNADSSTPRD